MKEPLFTRVFVLASLAHFLHALSYNLYLHLPGFFKALGADEVQIGVLFGVTAATAIAARPWLGRFMDTRGRRGIILAGGALNVLVSPLYLTIGGFGPWAFLVRMLHGLSEAMLFASLFAFAADIVPASRRIEGLALFGISGMLPISLGSLAGDLVLAHGSYVHLFATSAGLAALALALSLPLRDVPRALDEAPARGLRASFGEPALRPLWVVGMAFATAIAAHFSFFKTYVMTTHVGSVGLFFSAYSIAAVALRVLLGKLPERVGPKRVLYPALFAMTLGLILVARATSATDIAVAGIFCGVGHGYTFPILLGLVVARARPSERGAALAIFTALFDAGTLVGGPLFGAVIRGFGYAVMFVLAASIVLVGALAFALLDARAPRSTALHEERDGDPIKAKETR